MSKLITIVGPSGIGKTTLAHALAEQGSTALRNTEGFATAFEQHKARPFQALFNHDPRYGLANQIDYLLFRAEQERALRAAPQIGLIDGGLDLDYHGFTRLFHARGLLTGQELDLCRRLYETLRELQLTPELIIRLRGDKRTVANRLFMRDRINIASAEDFTLMESFLDEWLDTFPRNQIIEIDVTDEGLDYSGSIRQILARVSQQTW